MTRLFTPMPQTPGQFERDLYTVEFTGLALHELEEFVATAVSPASARAGRERVAALERARADRRVGDERIVWALLGSGAAAVLASIAVAVGMA